VGHLTDEILEVEGAHPGAGTFSGHPQLANWYNYDEETHILSTKGDLFVVRTGEGGHFKFRITGYNSGRYSLTFEEVGVRVTQESMSAVAPGPVYVNLRAGVEVVPEDPSTDLGWDLSIDGTTLRANGGASGEGSGGAVAADVEDFDAVEMAPAQGYVSDGEEGNSALSAWFESPEPGLVVPTLQPFVLRTADGGAVKIQFQPYEDGRVGFVWAYAGAGRDIF
jgi:hypothetical protein